MKTNKKIKIISIISLVLLLNADLVSSIELCNIPAFQSLPFCTGAGEPSGGGIQKSFLCRFLGIGCKVGSGTGDCDYKKETANCYCVDRTTGECCNDGSCDTCNSVCEFRNVEFDRCEVGQMMGCDYTQSEDGIICMDLEDCGYSISSDLDSPSGASGASAGEYYDCDCSPIPECPDAENHPDHIDGYYYFTSSPSDDDHGDDKVPDYISIEGKYKVGKSGDRDFDLSGSFTYEVWINPQLKTNSGSIIKTKAAYNKDLSTFYYLNYDYFKNSPGNGEIKFYHVGDSCSSGSDIPMGDWSYVAVTYDPSSDRKVKFYVNGKESVGEHCNIQSVGSNIEEIQIGREYSGVSDNFNGFIDEIRISDEARSPAWIAASYYTMKDDFINYGEEESGEDSSWDYKRKLSFKNIELVANLYGDSDTELLDFPVMVKLKPDNFDYSKVKSDGSDIKFVGSSKSGTRVGLKWHIEKWNYGGTSWIWVKVPKISIRAGSDDYFWMYYGKAESWSNSENEAKTYDSSFELVMHLDEESIIARDSTNNNNDGEIWGATYNKHPDYNRFYVGSILSECDDENSVVWREKYARETCPCENPIICVVCCERPPITTTTSVTSTTVTTTSTTTTIPCGFLKIFKFNDLNGNEVWETGEDRLAGWQFNIRGGPDNMNFNKETNSDGHYFTECLPFGDYIIEEEIQTGWESTTGVIKKVTIDSAYLKEVKFGNRRK